MRKLILIALLAVSAQAHAWGDREQGALAGIAGVLLLQQITQPRVVVPAQPIYTPVPVVPYYPGTMYPDYIHRPMYRAVDVFIPECQCYRTMMVRIN